MTPGHSSRSDAVARLRTELERLIAELSREPPAVGVWQPAVDVIDDGEAYRVEVELPGMSSHDVVVELQGHCLVVRGSRPAHPEASTARRFHLLERPVGGFEVTATLDEPVRAEDVRAVLSGGVLTVTLPHLAERRGQLLTIPVIEEEKPSD